MPDVRSAGPWRTFEVDGMDVPYYIIPFDKHGFCTAPATRQHLLDAVRDGAVTDAYVFSHGWNNDWDVVEPGGLYERLIGEFLDLVAQHGRPLRGARPVLVGVFWPSMALTSNLGPQMAAGGRVDAHDEARGATEAAELADEVVADADRARFYALTARAALDEDEARELAGLLLPLYERGEDEVGPASPGGGGDATPADADELVALWRALAAADAGDAEHTVVTGLPPEPGVDDATEAAAVGGPEAAGLLDLLDPRWIVRGASVLVMKDRAGRVGANGVKDLVHGLQRRVDGLRVHLVGHSYGCKVVLSAVAAAEPPRPVRSILLLQPALSYLAFGQRVPGTDRAGGYRAALARCELPIMTTFSRKDVPLRRLFHLGVRRASDVGEQDIGVAARDAPRSRFAAMGGYGPGGLSADEVRDAPLRSPADGRYDLPGPPVEVLALEGHDHIRGHGDVANEATAWALYNLVAAAASHGDDPHPRDGDG